MNEKDSKDENTVKKQVTVPDGLEQCLIDFTIDVIKIKPGNLYEHAVNYFTKKFNDAESHRNEMNKKNSMKYNNNRKPTEIKVDGSFDTIDDNNDNDNNYAHMKSRRNSIFTRTYNPEDGEELNSNNNNTNDNDDNSNGLEDAGDSLIETNKEKNAEIRDKLSKILRSIVMFKHLYVDDFNQIVDSMFEKKCKENEVIITEGDDGNYFYVIDRGTYSIYKKQQGNNTFLNVENSANVNSFEVLYGKRIGEYKNSGYFGELALLYNQPRSATIISNEDDGVLWVMNRHTFQRLVISNAFKRRKLYEEFLRAVPLLQECMNDYERTQVADSLTTHAYNKNDCIIKEGDLANGMYFIEEGSIEIIKDSHQSDGGIFTSILEKGSYFGELALINKTARSASAYCHSETCKVAFLSIDAFERLMGPCIDLIKQNINNYTTFKI